MLSHIGFGEIAGFCFLVVAIYLFNRTEKGLARAKCLSLLGTLAAVLSWIIGGYYYVTHYGSKVKPVLIAESSNLKWAHKIVIEAKEHIFLFIPILAIAVFILLTKTDTWEKIDTKTANRAGMLSLLIFALVILITTTGAIVSTSVRAILGGGI